MGIRDAYEDTRPADATKCGVHRSGHQHGHPCVRLDARTGADLPAHARGAIRARDHDRGRSLHRLARPARSPTSYGEIQIKQSITAKRREAGAEVRSAALPRRHPGDQHRCRCRCWRSACETVHRRRSRRVAGGHIRPVESCSGCQGCKAAKPAKAGERTSSVCFPGSPGTIFAGILS